MNKAVSQYMRALQRRSSRSRWGKMSKEERSEAARKLARKRWGKVTKAKQTKKDKQ